MITVIKRNGLSTEFNPQKIKDAVLKAFVEVEGPQVRSSLRVADVITGIVNKVVEQCRNQDAVTVEDIQDMVEQGLGLSGEQKVTRAYVLYRAEHERLRGAQEKLPKISYLDEQNERHPLTLTMLVSYLRDCCAGHKGVSPDAIAKATIRNTYDNVAWADVLQVAVMTCSTLIETEPAYSYAAAGILLKQHKVTSRKHLKISAKSGYGTDLIKALEHGVAIGQLNPDLIDGRFNLKELGAAIDEDRDQLLELLSAQTLYDRYFQHDGGVRYERMQVFMMRVAMGLALEEKEPTRRAIEFYNLMSTFDYMASTPTLFNAGTMRPQLSSCYLTTVPDDLSGIYHAIHDNAMLSKFAGGLGNDWTPVRALGS